MSTSLLYHAFGIRGYNHVNTQFIGGDVFFWIEDKSENLRCPVCRSRHIIRKGSITRWFKSVPIGKKMVWIVLSIKRVYCSICKLTRQVKHKFAEPRRSYTKAFERYVLDLSKYMTIQDVAQHLGVSWDIVKEIQKKYLKRRYSQPKLNKLKLIAIDEIAVKKGHKYLTVVLDLITGAVVFVGDGKGSESLDPFWKRLNRYKSNIKAVAIDMSPAYISAILDKLPQAQIVFDHFHVIKLYNDKLSKLRRQLYKQVSEKDKAVIKGTRWLLLKNPENLDQSRNEQQRLQKALEINQPLAMAYYGV